MAEEARAEGPCAGGIAPSLEPAWANSSRVPKSGPGPNPNRPSSWSPAPVSQDSYEYPGEIVILKGFEEATTDEDNNEEGNEF